MSQVDKIVSKAPLDELASQSPNPLNSPPLNQPAPPIPEVKSKPWPVSVLSLLLLLQAGGLFDLGLFFFTTGLGLTHSPMIKSVPVEPIDTLVGSIVFIPLSLVALLAAIGFARLWRSTWLMAMLVQGLCLLTALVLYFNNQRPVYVYIIMLYSILMVIYLNYFEVYATFQPTSILAEPEEEL